MIRTNALLASLATGFGVFLLSPALAQKDHDAVKKVDVYDQKDKTQVESYKLYPCIEERDKAYAELDKVYKQVITEYAKDKLFIGKLKASQEAWDKFATTYVDSRFPATDRLRTYGTDSRFGIASIESKLAEFRTKQLQEWLEGMEEADCSQGSIRLRK